MMEKEFESLEKIDNTLCLNNNRGNIVFAIDIEEHTDCASAIEMTECLEVLKQAIIESKAIKEAKPSEAMEILLKAKQERLIFYGRLLDNDKIFFEKLEPALLKAQELEKKNAEYKEALRIIKEKDVNIWYLTVSTNVKNYKDYNSFLMNDKSKRQLTEEEFELVRRVLHLWDYL